MQILEIVDVIDWKFTYASTFRILFAAVVAAPRTTKYWLDSIDAWPEVYEHRLQTFFEVLVERDDARIQPGWMEEQERLSGLTGEPKWKISGVIMRHGRILLFDAIYWQGI
jgi:hypothetical protein